MSAMRIYRLCALLTLVPATAAWMAACSSDDSAAPTPTTDSGSAMAARNDASPQEDGSEDAGSATLADIKHFVVIYMENHSFDNLYGEFPGADGVAGLDAAAPTVRQLNGDA